MTMCFSRSVGGVLAVALGLASAPLTAVEKKEVKIATMRAGTSWYVFGATLYQLLKKDLPRGTRIEVIAKGGGISNPMMVNSGKATIGLSNVSTSIWAQKGQTDVYRGKKQGNIRALVGGLNQVWLTAMVRQDYVRKTGQDTLEKILLGKKPVRIVMKPRGSSVPVVAGMVFEALGTSRKKLEARGCRFVQVDARQIPGILRDGRADLYFETAPAGHPTVTEVSLTANVKFLDLPPKVQKILVGRGLNAGDLPKTFKGQSGPTPSVDLGTVIIAHKDLSEEIAYRITKTICENKEAMARAHKAWSQFVPENAGKREHTGIALHPGAERFYRERGWLEKGTATSGQ